MKKTTRGRQAEKAKKGGGKSYVIKDVSPELWRGVKMRAAERGETVKSVVMSLLVEYAAGESTLG